MTGLQDPSLPAPDVEEPVVGADPSKGRSSYLRRLAERPSFWISATWLVVVVLASVAAPILAPYGSNDQDLSTVLATPSWHHLLGTDELGRDLLSRLMYGGGISLAGAGWATLVALAISLPFGVSAGYFGGLPDSAANRFADLLFSLPGLVVLLAIEAIFGSNQWVVMSVLGLILSAPLIRLAAITARAARKELYVDAALVAGLPHARVITRHILPNIAAPIVIAATSTLSLALLIETGLGFLGLGPQPPAPSWGGLVAEASSNIYTGSFMVVPTGAVLMLTILAFNFIGDAIRDSSPGLQRASILQLRKGRKADGVAPLLTPAPAPDALDVDVRSDEGGATAEAPLLDVKGLRVAFTSPRGAVAVVDGTSFRVHRGETLGIVGESGSGKTITALALLGLLPPAAQIFDGTIRFDGEDLTDGREGPWDSLRGTRIAYVPQEPMVALDPSFTIGSQVVEPIRRHTGATRREAKRRAVELLDMVGIPQPDAIFRSYPHQLSGGMAQRVAIAIALSCNPELVIADEPTTALDVTVQGEILDLLRSLQADLGMSLILVTHNLGVVADVCDRTVVMYAGQIVEDGAVEELFRRPLHPYTAGLLKSAPEFGEIGQPLPTIRGAVPLPVDWSTGCRFAPRCPYAVADCSRAPVPMVAPEGRRRSRCIRIDELFMRDDTDEGAAWQRS